MRAKYPDLKLLGTRSAELHLQLALTYTIKVRLHIDYTYFKDFICNCIYIIASHIDYTYTKIHKMQLHMNYTSAKTLQQTKREVKQFRRNVNVR